LAGTPRQFVVEQDAVWGTEAAADIERMRRAEQVEQAEAAKKNAARAVFDQIDRYQSRSA
jgi:hypothetical protein